MANHASAEKRARQNRKRRLRNRAHRSRMKTVLKKAEQALAAADRSEAQRRVAEALRILDKTASKGVIHRNKAARTKARLARRLHRLETSS